MKLILPTSITFPRKTKPDKRYMLNLNVYRNLNFIVNNQMKVAFSDKIRAVYDTQSELSEGCWLTMCENKVRSLLPPPPYRFTYTLFQESKRKTDVANVCCVVAKFAEDSLISLGIIPDDNHTVIPETIYRYGGVDKSNPRVELTIESIGGAYASSK